MGYYDGGFPSILCRLSPGARVDVVFNHTGPKGIRATFLGFEGNSALFLVDDEVLFIPHEAGDGNHVIIATSNFECKNNREERWQ